MESLRIPRSAAASIELSTIEGGPARPPDYIKVSLRSAGLEAASTIFVYGKSEMADFFQGLADSWRGWTGTQEWSSINHDLEFSCTHDGIGEVTVIATLRPYPPLDRWKASITFALDGASALERLASDLRALLRAGTHSSG